MRLLEHAIPNSEYDNLRVHTDMAYNHIDRIMGGTDTPAFVAPWMNHKVHLQVEQDFMNTSDFMRLYDMAAAGDQSADGIIQAMIQHTQQHAQLLAQSIMALQPQTASKPNEEPAPTGGKSEQGASE
jgi:hypothetical protein